MRRRSGGNADAGRRPRILYVTPFELGRVTSASELRGLRVARALRSLGEVRTAVITDADQAAASTGEFEVVARLEVKWQRSRSLVDKLHWLVNPRYEYPHGCGVSKSEFAMFMRDAAYFDLVWFFKLRTANMFPQFAWRRSVVDIDDLPSTFERSVVDSTAWPRKAAAQMRYMSWRRRDQILASRFEVLCVCSESDREYLRGLGVQGAVQVVPNGFERPRLEPVRQAIGVIRFGCIGLFDYDPNVDGIKWFVRECWPSIKRALPTARLRLIGHDRRNRLAGLGSDVDLLGYIEDPNSEIATWSCMVVPIHVGGGTRGKIAHALSRKCPIVSTSLGALGYELEDGREIRLADGPSDFVNACIEVARNPDSANEMAQRGWEAFCQRWSWDAISPSIRAAAECALQSSSARCSIV